MQSYPSPRERHALMLEWVGTIEFSEVNRVKFSTLAIVMLLKRSREENCTFDVRNEGNTKINGSATHQVTV